MQNLLVELLEENRANFNQLPTLVAREVHFPDVENKIKVAIGMRRAGKTYLLYQTMGHLLEQGIPFEQILYLSFEDDRLLPLSQKKLAQLLETFYALYPHHHEKRCYFFLDEIQNVEDWPLVIRRFFDSKSLDIYLTGSSAKLLSKEIATSLRGRSLATSVWPYSFKEYLQAKEMVNDAQSRAPETWDFKKHFLGRHELDKLKKQLISYLNEGGFPEVCHYSDGLRQQTLQDYVHVVTLRDIVERHKITNLALLKYLIKRLLHDVSSVCSMNKMYNDLKSQGYTVGKDTLYDYVSYLEDAFLCFSVPLYSESLRKSQINPKKNYAIDMGLVKAYTFSFSENLGRMFENLIYLDLRRENCEIFYYLTEKDRFEVDFVAITPQGQGHLFQVAWDVEDSATYERESRALEIAKKELNMPGSLITPEVYLRRIFSGGLLNGKDGD